MRFGKKIVVTAVLAAVVGLGATSDAAVQRSPWGIYTLRTNTRSSFGQGGVDTAQMQLSTGTMSGACLGKNGHSKGWGFGSFTKAIANRPRLQATNFGGYVQYHDGTGDLSRVRGLLRVQRQPNGRFRLAGNFRSVIHGRGTETTAFQGWQTTEYPF